MPTTFKAARNRARVGCGVLVGAAMLGALALFAGEAGAVSERVKKACERDYKRFCPSYAVGSSELRSCMSSKRRALSKRCTDALIDAGEMPRPSKKP